MTIPSRQEEGNQPNNRGDEEEVIAHGTNTGDDDNQAGTSDSPTSGEDSQSVAETQAATTSGATAADPSTNNGDTSPAEVTAEAIAIPADDDAHGHIPAINLSNSQELNYNHDPSASVAAVTSSAGHDELEIHAPPVAIASMVPDEGEYDIEQPLPGHHASYKSVSIMRRNTMEERFGIVFDRSDESTSSTILTIHKGGLLANSPIRPGDRIISINNQRCQNWGPDHTTSRLNSATGLVVIVTENTSGDPNLVQAMAVKPTPQSRVGVTIKRGSGNSLVIGNIDNDGLFAHSVLNKGDEVLYINDVSCSGMDAMFAAGVIESLPREVTLLTKTLLETGVVVSQLSERPGGAQDGTLAVAVASGNSREEKKMSQAHCCCFFLVLIAVIVFISNIGNSSTGQ